MKLKLAIPYYAVRHVSSPEDVSNDRKVYFGQVPITSILDLPTDENVRGYLLEAEGKKRKVPTQVHRAIKDTLESRPDCFSVLNSGIVIVAKSCNIDEKKKVLLLENPSIINGSQTQGVIKEFIQDNDLSSSEVPHVKFELIVTEDDGLVAEISIARNFQNDVLTISIAGRLGQLDELEKRLQEKIPHSKLKKSETKLSEDYVQTERILQVITALIPEEIWYKNKEYSKVYSYSQKTKCLKEFQMLYKDTHDEKSDNHIEAKKLYDFFLDIVDQAHNLYYKWKSHQGFKGTRLEKIKRDKSGKILDVPDGIVFPILASLAAFAKKTDEGWRITPPQSFDEAMLIQETKSIYQEIARSNPQSMGKSKACYSSLYRMTCLYDQLSK